MYSTEVGVGGNMQNVVAAYETWRIAAMFWHVATGRFAANMW